MSGWDKQYGVFISEKVDESEIRRLFNYVFSDRSKKTTSYKYAFLKAIIDSVYSIEDNGRYYRLELDDAFDKFSENYWNLVTIYHLKQNRETDKVSAIEKVLLKKRKEIGKVPYSRLTDDDKIDIVKAVKYSCKRYVIGALYEDFEGKFYGFDLKNDDYLKLNQSFVCYIRTHKTELEQLNYYSWAKFLEKISANKNETTLIKKLEKATPKRNDLSFYREILRNEFEEDCCFYCGSKLTEIHVDHVIPWSFMKEDNLWNFVLACPSCNKKKNDKLPNKNHIKLVVQRNEKLKKSKTSFVIEEMLSYPKDYEIIWEYAHNCGFEEMKPVEKQAV